MRSVRTSLLVVVALGVAGALAVQHQSIRSLRAEIAALSTLLSETQPAAHAPVAPAIRSPERVAPGGGDLPRRVAQLEHNLAQLTRASDYLMERGQLPLAQARIDELHHKFADASAGDRDRLQALRLLRRNNALTEETVQLAANWLNSATNSGVRENLLEQLAGQTNAFLRDPFLRLATTDADEDVREQAVENLRRFAADPQVESSLWQMLRAEADGDVREEIEDALLGGPASATRIASLRERALGTQSSIEERLLAMRALQDAKVDASDIAATLAQLAQHTQDPVERARLFQGFDEVNDPAFVPSLVQGLQDPNPAVRERAADALSDFRSDPNIQQWLRYVAENDADPLVRREAFRGLGRR